MLRPPECPLNNDSLLDDPAMMRDFFSQRNWNAYLEHPGNICDRNYQGQDTGASTTLAALSLRNRIPDCPHRVVSFKKENVLGKQGRYTLDSALHTLTSTELMGITIV